MALPLTDALLGCLPVVLPDRRYWFSWLQPGATVPGQIPFEDPEDPHIKEFRTVAPDPEQALPSIEKAYGDPGAAADTLGHIGLTQQVEQVAIALAATGDRTTAGGRPPDQRRGRHPGRPQRPALGGEFGTGRLGQSAEQLTSRESTVGGHDTMPTVLTPAAATAATCSVAGSGR
ncbi:hypothetical protein ACIBMX_46325 [Streptomyces phaeochromogenes]|uniref:hypothetical protein n=1 Tax=Streptomyces phaeochromogenes TaxID=1923 RepID=UPI0033CFFA10|nr:hypothetical protein OHB08_03680 [Streptomyces phaeochromogenes]